MRHTDWVIQSNRHTVSQSMRHTHTHTDTETLAHIVLVTLHIIIQSNTRTQSFTHTNTDWLYASVSLTDCLTVTDSLRHCHSLTTSLCLTLTHSVAHCSLTQCVTLSHSLIHYLSHWLRFTHWLRLQSFIHSPSVCHWLIDWLIHWLTHCLVTNPHSLTHCLTVSQTVCSLTDSVCVCVCDSVSVCLCVWLSGDSGNVRHSVSLSFTHWLMNQWMCVRSPDWLINGWMVYMLIHALLKGSLCLCTQSWIPHTVRLSVSVSVFHSLSADSLTLTEGHSRTHCLSVSLTHSLLKGSLSVS